MTLIIQRYNYKAINRDETTGVRLYDCPDGSKVPSVTSILSATQSSEKAESLEKWRNAVGHVKAKTVTTEAASRGTRLHKYLEDYALTGKLPAPGSNPYSKQSNLMAKAIIDNGLVHVNELWGSEIGLYYPGLYAGTADTIGVHKNEEAVLDYKQANKPKKLEHITDYFYQLVAYSLAHNNVYGTNIKKGVILMCIKPPEIKTWEWGEPQYLEFILEGKEFDRYTNLWWDRVEKYYKQF